MAVCITKSLYDSWLSIFSCPLVESHSWGWTLIKVEARLWQLLRLSMAGCHSWGSLGRNDSLKKAFPPNTQLDMTQQLVSGRIFGLSPGIVVKTFSWNVGVTMTFSILYITFLTFCCNLWTSFLTGNVLSQKISKRHLHF